MSPRKRISNRPRLAATVYSCVASRLSMAQNPAPSPQPQSEARDERPSPGGRPRSRRASRRANAFRKVPKDGRNTGKPDEKTPGSRARECRRDEPGVTTATRHTLASSRLADLTASCEALGEIPRARPQARKRRTKRPAAGDVSMGVSPRQTSPADTLRRLQTRGARRKRGTGGEKP